MKKLGYVGCIWAGILIGIILCLSLDQFEKSKLTTTSIFNKSEWIHIKHEINEDNTVSINCFVWYDDELIASEIDKIRVKPNDVKVAESYLKNWGKEKISIYKSIEHDN